MLHVLTCTDVCGQQTCCSRIREFPSDLRHVNACVAAPAPATYIFIHASMVHILSVVAGTVRRRGGIARVKYQRALC